MNYYDILKINKNASHQEIKTSYKKLIKRYHPDLYPGNKIKAETITRNLNEAYEILSDPEKKRIYDLSLEEQINENNKQYNSDNSVYDSQKNFNNETSFADFSNDTFENKIKKNIHNYVEKKTEKLLLHSKLKLFLYILFFSIFVFILTLVDYINYHYYIQEKQKIVNQIEENIINENNRTYYNKTFDNNYYFYKK